MQREEECFVEDTTLKPLDGAYNPLRILRQHAEEVKVGHGGDPWIDQREGESNAGDASFYPTPRLSPSRSDGHAKLRYPLGRI